MILLRHVRGDRWLCFETAGWPIARRLIVVIVFTPLPRWMDGWKLMAVKRHSTFLSRSQCSHPRFVDHLLDLRIGDVFKLCRGQPVPSLACNTSLDLREVQLALLLVMDPL
eukprot:TRINITY_DN12575_c0_g1::TRINITY_DN12575_c0_g1_i1::g.2687::m.2687 TRINITY_DN12575_c0_g1::TRINITY_DN12575_c0_g1_i1::g.2687  ORF type:complete len:111 (-),score=12.15 TRINITY_DN12575_c0_g1_i1:775-1107(-)